jgi:Peptidase M50B-like
LLAAPRPVVELQNSRRHGRAADSDADMLARLTGVTGLAWVAGFLLISVATLLIGASWLIGAARH